MPPEIDLDPATLDLNHVIADREGIRLFNPQRFEMEQIDAVVYEDTSQHIVAGYKDVRGDEFWVKGHMPAFPLLPGVLMCEAGAQMGSYYITKHKLLKCDFIGFGGMDNVRFRGGVYPGDRLVIVCKLTKLHRLQVTMSVQSFVGTTMVFHANIIGMPLMRNRET